ncbi:MAG TPA: hypothetical protein VFX95_07160 [Caulobacteraceae bacterium]|nr:hypothetical protein [Caulobacteraceae bacterium]
MHLPVRPLIGFGAAAGAMMFVLAALILTPPPADPAMHASQASSDCPDTLKARSGARAVEGA